MAMKAFLRQAAWSRSIASEKHLAIPSIQDVRGHQWELYSRAGLCLPTAGPWGSHRGFRALLPQGTCARNDLQKQLLHTVTSPRELKFPLDQSYSMAWEGYLAVHKGNEKGFS